MASPGLPGEQMMVGRESRLCELVEMGINRRRRTFKIRAVITDALPSLNASLEDVLTYSHANRVRLPGGPFSVWKHYGKTKAVFFDVSCDSAGILSHIGVEVNAILPELALGYARAAVNQFLDDLILMLVHPHPLTIQRLELLSPLDTGVLAFQITVPYQAATEMGPFGGIGPLGPLAGIQAILREAITNPSPYYKLLLAYRGFEGTARIRADFAKWTREHQPSAPPPTSTELDKTEMVQLRFPDDACNLKSLTQLVDHYRGFRDGIAHFVLDKNSKASGHLQFSSTMVNTCAKVSALLLKYLRIEILSLKRYYNNFMYPHIHIGMILPVVEARDRYMVVCPDAESKAEADDFN